MRTKKDIIKGLANRDCFYCKHSTGMDGRDVTKCKSCIDASNWETWVKVKTVPL